MRFIISIMFSLTFCAFVKGQGNPKADSAGWKPKEYKLASTTKWYSATTSKGITIQNSFPKGGPHTDSAGKKTGHSFLIFFTRIMNETATPLELTINFPADSFAIPHSP